MTNLVESWSWHIELALSPHSGSEILFLLSRDNHLTSMEKRANLVSSASMVSKMGNAACLPGTGDPAVSTTENIGNLAGTAAHK